jgi:hypothetical protein
MVEVAQSLAPEHMKAGFLGAEVKVKTTAEEVYSRAWMALASGDLPAVVELVNGLLTEDPTNEKCYYTRVSAARFERPAFRLHARRPPLRPIWSREAERSTPCCARHSPTRGKGSGARRSLTTRSTSR